MKDARRHQWVWNVLRPVVRPILRYGYGFRMQPLPALPQAYLLLCNHTISTDPIFAGVHFPRHMYFVASEHLFRKGWLSKLLTYFLAPIPRLKGTQDLSMLRAVLQRLRGGNPVCIYPEGCCSYNGLPSPITPAIGKLVKMAGVPLVTYRTRGGYLSNPRWARSFRRGHIESAVVQVYEPAQLKAMTADEITARIRDDLYHEDYAFQRERGLRWRGRHLAEYLETALFLCPQCGGIATMHSHGDRLSCTCGHRVRIDAQGYFHGMDGAEAPFATVTAWDTWQKEQLPARLAGLDEHTPVAQSHETLYRLCPRKGRDVAARGAAALYRDRLQVGEETYRWADVSDMTIHSRDTLMFSVAGEHFEMKADRPRSALLMELTYRHWLAQQACSTQA